MKAIALCLALVMTLTVSRPAKAAIGIAVLHPMALVGLVVAGGGMFGAIKILKKSEQTVGFKKALLEIFGLGVGFIGALGFSVLDGDEGQTMSFREVSLEESAELGFTQVEFENFNSEIDQANFLLSEATNQISQIENPSSEDSRLVWDGLKDQVSPETFSAMQKIVLQ